MKTLLLASTLLLLACSSQPLCGSHGSRFDAEHGASYCVYDQAIVVEGGFQCPTGFTAFKDFGDFRVCSVTFQDLDRLPEPLCQRYDLECRFHDGLAYGDGGIPQRDGGKPTRSDPCGDDDGDGLPNASEYALDVDGDGLVGNGDTDSDNDGILDGDEAGPANASCQVSLDCDGDVLPNHADPDSDNDGISDGEELAQGTSVCDSDSDGNGCPDVFEADGCRPEDVVVQVASKDEFDCNVSTFSIVAPTSIGSVFLELDSPGTWILALPLDAEPTSGASRGDMSEFLDVKAGTQLRYKLSTGNGPPESFAPGQVSEWRLMRDFNRGDVVGQGRLFIPADATICADWLI